MKNIFESIFLVEYILYPFLRILQIKDEIFLFVNIKGGI
jgi:hypothetical protein